MHLKQTLGELSEPGARSIFTALLMPRLSSYNQRGFAELNALLAWYRDNVNTSKQPERRSRAKTTGTLVGTRFQPDLLEAIDLWRKAQSDLPTRPEAVRRLVELGMRSEDSSLGDLVPPALNSARTAT